MSLAVLAYPQLSRDYYNFIQEFRSKNDRHFPLFEPHFTFVFPVYDIKENDFKEHIIKTAARLKPAEFTLNCAITVKDFFSEFWEVFLVPDKGNSTLIKMHDLLYKGLLITHLRIDIPFIPHINIGSDVDPFHCINLAGELNNSDISIAGRIEKLSIVRIEENSVETIEDIVLR